MPKAIPVLILALLLSAAMALWGWSEVSTTRGLLHDQTELRKAAEAREKKLKTNIRTVENRNAALKTKLDDALRTTPDRATPVPVYNVLCERGNCRKP